MDTELTERRRWGTWLAAAGLAVAVACLVPPLSVLARRYLFVESVQFCVFAMAAPALVVLGAGRLLPRGPARLRQRGSFVPVLGYLVAWAVTCLFWRLPPVLDQLARHPVLVAAEAVTLCAAGIGLWLALARPRPSAPPLGPAQRAGAAALAMWSIWVIAYILGFARGSVVRGYDGGGSHLLTVDDQEISAFLLWAAAAAAFLPVVFTAGLSWLKDGPAEEPAPGEPAPREPAPAAPAPAERAVVPAVRGWGPPVRARRRH